MHLLLDGEEAFGAPGIEPRWTSSAKEAVGTAYNTASRVWFTISDGILNEVYFPTIDRPQIRDLQFLITDGKTFCHEERRDMITSVENLDEHSLGYRVVNEDPDKRYRLVKEIVSDPHLPCVLMRTRLEGKEEFIAGLKLYALLAPHAGGGGKGNTAARVSSAGHTILAAFKERNFLAMASSSGFRRTSCGFVGASDGWTDIKGNFIMDWEFGHAKDGNVAMTAEIDLSRAREFTLGLAFGGRLHGAVTTLFESLALPFSEQRERFQKQWSGTGKSLLDLAPVSHDGGKLYRASHGLLLAHEDKTYPGAMIASLSIPWGFAHGDEDGLGGYHLVWTRDMCQSAGALMACGNMETARRALIYLAVSQKSDGGFYQSFWIDGEPYWRGVQLDETAFPLILAWRLATNGILRSFAPYYPMVLRAARFLVCEGPVTAQERWEENSGFSPSTLAAVISGLICAADMARRHGDEKTAVFLEEYADFIEARLEDWTVTSAGTLLPRIPRHYIRILPADPEDPCPSENPDQALLDLRNVAPGEPSEIPARNIVDSGFLELVRYGIRRPDDPLIVDSLKVIDAVLKIETPSGPCWRRYNHDGYGQRQDGGPFLGWGRGRPWPLLTGERGHYELAAGRDASAHVSAMERFATVGGMLPEQIWDEADKEEIKLFFGRPTGSAMPLLWAHAEYVKLLRSARDGVPFDRIAPVEKRYRDKRSRPAITVWKFNYQTRCMPAGGTLRIIAGDPFRLHSGIGGWSTPRDADSTATQLGLHYVDVPVPAEQKGTLVFTFYWPQSGQWEGKDFSVSILPRKR